MLEFPQLYLVGGLPARFSVGSTGNIFKHKPCTVGRRLDPAFHICGGAVADIGKRPAVLWLWSQIVGVRRTRQFGDFFTCARAGREGLPHPSFPSASLRPPLPSPFCKFCICCCSLSFFSPFQRFS